MLIKFGQSSKFFATQCILWYWSCQTLWIVTRLGKWHIVLHVCNLPSDVSLLRTETREIIQLLANDLTARCQPEWNECAAILKGKCPRWERADWCAVSFELLAAHRIRVCLFESLSIHLRTQINGDKGLRRSANGKDARSRNQPGDRWAGETTLLAKVMLTVRVSTDSEVCFLNTVLNGIKE